MRILFDFTSIPVQRTGAGIYADNLIRELIPLLRPEDTLFLLIQDDEKVLETYASGKKNVIFLRIRAAIFRRRALLMLYEQLVIPWILLIKKIDLLHSPHYTLPYWSLAKKMVTFHDFTHFLFPELHTRERVFFMRLYIWAAWRKAKTIAFVSDSTRRDAERLLPPGYRHIHCITPLGVTQDAFLHLRADEIEQGLATVGVRQPYMLSIGTVEPRKNFLRVIQAFEAVAEEFPQHILVLAGKPGWHFEPVFAAIEKSPVKDRILHLGYISDEMKHMLLAGASLVLYPSIYEGFGLPVLEAMAAGVPVITSNVSSMPEVAGDAGIMIDPESTDELISAIRRMLHDPELMARSRERGLERARLFSWSNTAAATYKAYEDTCKL